MMKKTIGVLTSLSLLIAYISIGRTLFGVVFLLLGLFLSFVDFREAELPIWIKRILDIFILISGTIISAYSSQMILNQNLLSLGLLRILLNCGIIISIIMIIFALIGSETRAITITSVLILLLTIADYYVYRFRGSELAPLDFLSAKTA